MEKTEFKQTEVGVIPRDWEVQNLEFVAEIIMGQSPKGNSYNRNEIGSALINGPTEFTDRFPIKIQWTSEPTKFCQNGDILLCVRGSSTGRINISNDRYCIGRGVSAIRAKDNCTQMLLEYLTRNAVQSILSKTSGSTFPNIDGKSLKSIQVALPPTKAEQAAIAAALNDADALITQLEKLIAKKRNIKQGAMQELITGEKRLPGFEKKNGYKQTEVGIIPSDWELKKLTNIAEICTGSTPPTSDHNNYGNDYFFVTPADLGKGRLIQNTEKKLSTKGFNLSRKYPKKSILFTCIGSTIGKSGIADRELTSNQQINAIFPNTTFDSDYLYYVLNLLSNRIKKGAGETAVPIINKSDFGELPIPLPPTKAEQTRIAKILSDMDAEIEALEKKLEKYKMIKQGMMQELLTGKTRLV